MAGVFIAPSFFQRYRYNDEDRRQLSMAIVRKNEGKRRENNDEIVIQDMDG